MQTEKDCKYFEWVDPPASKWIKQLLLDLKDAVFGLKSGDVVDDVEAEQENQSLLGQMVNLEAQLQSKDELLLKKDAELIRKDAELLKKDAELLKKDAELVKKDAQIEAMKKELKAMEVKMNLVKKNNGRCSFCCLIWICVMGVLVAMMLKASRLN